MVWPTWPPGCHSGEGLGGLWLTVWGACRVEREGRGSEEVASEPSQGSRAPAC